MTTDSWPPARALRHPRFPQPHPDDRNTERSPTLEASRDGDYIVLTVVADGFARELVRRLVSLARAVGTGEASLEKLSRALASEPLPGHEGIAPRRRNRSC